VALNIAHLKAISIPISKEWKKNVTTNRLAFNSLLSIAIERERQKERKKKKT